MVGPHSSNDPNQVQPTVGAEEIPAEASPDEINIGAPAL